MRETIKGKRYVWAAIASTIFGASLAWATDYYDATGAPAQGSSMSSAVLRSEYALIQSGVSAKLPPLTGNGGEIVAVNSAGTALTSLTMTDHAPLVGDGTGGILALTPLTTGQVLVGVTGADPAAQSGATLRTSLGLGTADTVTFTDLTVSDDVIVGDDMQFDSAAASIFANSDLGILLTENAGVGLYYNNVRKIASSSTGIRIHSVNSIATPPTANPGEGEIRFYDADETDLIGVVGFASPAEPHFYVWNTMRDGHLREYVTDAAGNNESVFNAIPDGATTLYHAGSSKITTSATGATISGVLTATDQVTATGDVSVGDDIEFGSGTSQVYAGLDIAIEVVEDGATTLNHNGTAKVATSAAGATVTGTLNATTDVTVNGASLALDSDELVDYKTADQTVSASTTYVDDTHISIAGLEADTVYTVELFLYVTQSGGTGGLKFKFVPSQTMQDGRMVLSNEITDNLITSDFSADPDATPSLVGTGFIYTHATLATTLKLQWAQFSASGSTTLNVGSWLRLRKMGAA